MLFHVRMDVHIRMTPILSMSTHCAERRRAQQLQRDGTWRHYGGSSGVREHQHLRRESSELHEFYIAPAFSLFKSKSHPSVAIRPQ